MAGRLDQWSNPKVFGLGVTHPDAPLAKAVDAARRKLCPPQEPPPEKPFTTSDLLRQCRELILDIRDGQPVFHAVSYYVNGETFQMEAGLLFELTTEDEEGEPEGQGVRNILAIAAIEEVPVYPNTKEIVPYLANQHRRMLLEGFTAPHGDKGRVRLRFAKRPTQQFDDPQFLRTMDCSISIFPAEIEILRELAEREFSRLERAHLALGEIRQAREELGDLLCSSTRNEGELQRCLTAHPVLFGMDYTRVVPKHRLGAEFEMDYALERLEGGFDLVEIESSNLPLFTKSGNPSAALVHAEQQVLDWHDWLDENAAYARQSLPGLIVPKGFVVIGTRRDMNDRDNRRLRRRNAHWGGKIIVMTYDDLLARAEAIENTLLNLTSGRDADESAL